MRSFPEGGHLTASLVPTVEDLSFSRIRSAKVTSRLYMVALDPNRFAPYTDFAGDWMGVVATEACGLGMKFELDAGPPGYRKCWYVDTVDGCLRRNGLSLQVMDEGFRDKRYRIKLNGVHRDRFLAAMTSVAGRGGATNEFVEEIHPTHSWYVKSSEQRRHKLPRLHTVADVIKLFPGAGQQLESRCGEQVTIVEGLVVSELLDDIGRGWMGNAAPVAFAMAASYTGSLRLGRSIEGELEKHMPDSIDFTFRYESLRDTAAMERFSPSNIVPGWRLFETLSSKRAWVERDHTRF